MLTENWKSQPKQGTDQKTRGQHALNVQLCLAIGTSGDAATRANALSSSGCFNSRRVPCTASQQCDAMYDLAIWAVKGSGQAITKMCKDFRNPNYLAHINQLEGRGQGNES